MESKPCRKCGVEKPLDDFYQDRSRSDGRRNTCIACDQVRKRTPEVREQNHRYYHSEKGKAAEARYRESEKGKASRAAYEERPERIEKRRAMNGLYARHYYYSDKGRATRQREADDPERRNQRRMYGRAYHQRKGDDPRYRTQRVVYEQARLAKKRALPATFTEQEWQQALSWFKHRCAYCGADGALIQEHVIPVSANGPYTKHNIVPACRSCNNRKHSKPLLEWVTTEAFTRIVHYFAQLV